MYKVSEKCATMTIFLCKIQVKSPYRVYVSWKKRYNKGKLFKCRWAVLRTQTRFMKTFFHLLQMYGTEAYHTVRLIKDYSDYGD